ncbi:MAG: flap endonuclease [Deltaproteobacteria bacterium]|nr:MAG: flap endonuclease [Deltaproteobacteria bacterium]
MRKRPEHLHLVDGTYELFRAHYSKRPERRAADGRPVKATLGVVATLKALLKDETEGVTHIAAAFDNPIESFRNDLFDGYKTGEGIDPDLRAQFDLVEEAVAALGITVWRMGRYEADDALATAAARWKDEVGQVRLMTPDKDLAQCVEDGRVVLVDRRRGRVYDEAAVLEKYGVYPESIPDWLALVGDPADGIPGLPGWGARSAAAVLRCYRHLEAIPADPAAWQVKVRGAKRLAAVLEARREEARLYRRLATLVTDVDLGVRLEDLRYRGPTEAWPALEARLRGA